MVNSEYVCPHCQGKLKTIPLSSTPAEFSHSAPLLSLPANGSSQKGFWNSDGATTILTGFFAGSLVWLYTWWYGYDPIWAVLVGLGAGLGLAVLKVMLQAPPRLKSTAKAASANPKVVQAELSVDKTSKFIAVFDLSEPQLLHVAQGLIEDGKPFSRRGLCKPGTLSQSEYDKLRQEMSGRGWLDFDENNPNAGATLNRAGRAVMRAMLADLSPT